MKPNFLTRLITSLLLAALVLPGLASAGTLQGPIRVRDLSPFSLQRLDFQPASALAEVPGRWALELNLSQTNTYVMSGNVADYLQTRGSRAPIGPADVAALNALGEDYYFVDSAITVLHITGHYALSDAASVYAVLPVQWHKNGFLDNSIESFHNTLDFPNANRQYVSQNDYTMLLRLNGEQVQYLQPPGSGLGDPVLGFRYRDLSLGEWAVVLEAAVTLPLGTVDPFFANGAADAGMQVSLQHQWQDRHGLYLSFNQVWVGAPDTLHASTRRRVPSATLAYEYALGPDSSFIAQYTVARSSLAEGPDAELTANSYQASIGWRKHLDDRVFITLAFTENLITFNNTPDIGLHAGIAWAY